MSVALDWFALGLVALFGLLVWAILRLTQRYAEPFWKLSSLRTFTQGYGVKSSYSHWSRRLYWTALVFFLCAFLDPRFLVPLPPEEKAPPHNQTPKEGIAIYLVIDQSGSMQEMRGNQSKIALTKDVAQDFVKGRPNDLIGLITFARAANVASPLTLDHGAVLEELAKLDVVKDPNQDGTAMGYAIFKTASLIAATKAFAVDLKGKGKPAYELRNAIIVLVTDGVPDPNPADKESRWRTIDVADAAAYAKEQGVRLYVVNVDPEFAQAQYAPHRRILTKSTEATGGRLFMVDSKEKLMQVFREIDAIEKSALPPLGLGAEKQVKKKEDFKEKHFYPWLIGFGLLCLFFALILETSLLKRTP